MMRPLLLPIWRIVDQKTRALRPWVLWALLGTIISLLSEQSATAELISTPVWVDVYDDVPPHALVEANVPLETYVKRVLPNEWNPDWEEEALKVGAVAARTWVLSSENWKDINGDGVKETYAVYDGEAGQNYISGSENEATDPAVESTVGIYITHNYRVINAQYRAENGDPTNPDPLPPGECLGPGTTGWQYDLYPYLVSISDPVSAGYPRSQDACNSVGVSQNGTQRWASQYNWTWQQMLYHYYTAVEFQQLYASTGEYYPNDYFGGSPVAVRTDTPIDFDWGDGVPTRWGYPVPGMPADNFTVRWTGTIEVPATDWYTFYVIVDDNVRLWVDNQLILDEWDTPHAAAPWASTIFLTQGAHHVRLDYRERTGQAVIKLSWLRGQGMVGYYFTNGTDPTGPAGNAAMVRIDVPINYDWPGDVSPKNTYPNKVVSADIFAVRWEGQAWSAQQSRQTLFATVDDGIRFDVDGIRRIDEWRDQSRTTFLVPISLGPGRHDLQIQFYERYGDAYARAGWTAPVYLPSILRNYPPCAQPIQNGDFEAGSASWALGSGTAIRTDMPHSGSYSARLGGENNANDILYQTLTIPSTGPTGQAIVSAHLSYYWYMTTEEVSHPWDHLYVKVRDVYGNDLATLETLSDGSIANTWVASSFDVSAYIGRTIQVHFQAITDGSFRTSFFIDDVSLYACEEG